MQLKITMHKPETEIKLCSFINLHPEQNLENDNIEKSYLISSINKVKMGDMADKDERKQHHQ